MKASAFLALLFLAACQPLPVTPDSSLADKNPWPIAGMLALLADTPLNQTVSVKYDNADTTFEVTSEYQSAAGTLCRAYRIGEAPYLACKDTDWQPVTRLP